MFINKETLNMMKFLDILPLFQNVRHFSFVPSQNSLHLTNIIEKYINFTVQNECTIKTFNCGFK